jgi:hypothetical protein
VSTPRRPYSRLLQGCIDDALKLGASKVAALLLALVLTHRAKRSIPGLVCFGPSGLAESLSGLTHAEVKRALAELAKHRLILSDFDARPPLLYVVGAVKADPPTTENSTRGMAIQYAELPASAVKRHVHQEITDALRDSQWLSKWMEWTTPDANPGPDPESGHGPGPLRDPIPIPRSETDPAAAARFQSAWDRCLVRPPFAAAAAGDFLDATKIWTNEVANSLLMQLGCSKWTTGKLDIAPTLRRLVSDPAYAQRIINGEFAGKALHLWLCPTCMYQHPPLDDCPAPQKCGRRHPARDWCAKCRDLDYQEQLRQPFASSATSSASEREPVDEAPAPTGGMPDHIRQQMREIVGRRTMR